MVQNCLKPTTSSRSTGVRTLHMDGAILLTKICSRQRNVVEIGNRNMTSIEIAVENANLCGKNMRYAHFAEICGNMRTVQKSHIRIKQMPI